MNPVADEKTGLGNYFIANYPPFSFWKPSYLPDAITALNSDRIDKQILLRAPLSLVWRAISESAEFGI